MKIVTIIGARPQFIKAAALSKEISKNKKINEIIIHTGQHFDYNMSNVFFEQMNIPKPHYNLGINNMTHGAMTGNMLIKIEQVLFSEKPEWVVLYGDTNSTLAGAIAAKKLNINIAHIESGLRSYNWKMPEETNRILTDRISNILFCPTENAVKNLIKEGYKNFTCKIVNSGDIMLDSSLLFSSKEKKPPVIIKTNFILATIHRAENTDNLFRLTNILDALKIISKKNQVLLPLHPRTNLIIKKIKYDTGKIKIINPIGYLEMIYLLKRAKLIMTDSGGLQKEAFFFRKPCITLRDETEWTELTENGFNTLTGADSKKILFAFENQKYKLDFSKNLFGSGNAAKIILKELLNYN